MLYYNDHSMTPALNTVGLAFDKNESMNPRLLGAGVLLNCLLCGLATAGVPGQVVASIKPVHSLVSGVMAGVGEPYLIIQGRASPHTFSLRPSDAKALEGARVVFLIDELVETSLAHSIDALVRDARVVVLSQTEGLIHRPLREGGGFEVHEHGRRETHAPHGEDGHGHQEKHGSNDMHFWLDPVNAAAMVRMIAEALSETDPSNAETYAANARMLLDRLEALAGEISNDLAPVREKPFIVFHDAYQHFEDRFGLTAVGSVVVSADHSPGVRRVMELRDKIRRLGATCVFSEVQFDSRLVDTIIEDTSARAGILDPLGATAVDGSEAYFDLLRNMAAAFGNCLAPAG